MLTDSAPSLDCQGLLHISPPVLNQALAIELQQGCLHVWEHVILLHDYLKQNNFHCRGIYDPLYTIYTYSFKVLILWCVI